MSQSGNGQPRIEQLPYYQEYLEQILRPRVVRVLDDVRPRLAEYVWQELLARTAHEQGDTQPTPESLDRLRSMLEATLGLQIEAHFNATFSSAPAAAPRTSENTPQRQNVEVVDRSFPDNPLARAVGSVRRVNR
jgi:hypothetical protein